MKTAYKILVTGFIASLFITTSCQDFLELSPQEAIEDERVIETMDDLELATLGTYSSFVSEYYKTLLWTEASTDNCVLRVGIPTEQIHNWSWNTTIFFIDDIWRNGYQAIAQINATLGRMDDIEGDQKIKDHLKGELLFMRGLAYYDIVRLYRPALNDVTKDGPGAPLLFEVADPTSQPMQVSLQEVYDQIVIDLEDASELMTLSYTDWNATRATSLAAKALLARVYLSIGNYEEASVLAAEVIEDGPVLAEGDVYLDMWNDTDAAGESIFKLAVTEVDQVFIGNLFWDKNNPTKEIDEEIQYTPSQDLYALYENEDLRKSAFYKDIMVDDEIKVAVSKYEGGAVPNLADIKVLRMSEMYLIKAEASIKMASADPDAALEALNAVRMARNAPPFLTTTDLGVRIAEEFRMELAFEGDRWFNLKRKGEPINRADCGILQCELEADDHRFVWPVPRSETDVNTNVEQNPGY